MYLKRSRRNKQGETYESWSLVESVRTARGPRQRVVATLGKLPGLDEKARVGWEHIGDILDGKARMADAARLFEVEISEQADPFEKKAKRLTIAVRRKAELEEWAARADGAYLLRTNLTGRRAEELWHTYIGLTQIEDSFRIAKHDLRLRTVSRPEPHLAILLDRLGLFLPNRPKKIRNIVATFSQKNRKIEEIGKSCR